MQFAIITGEASGDRVGGQLAAEILCLHPDALIWGTGGKHLRESGAEVIIDSSRWGVVGAAQALSLMPVLLKAAADVRKELLRRPPDVVIAVDAGAVHVGFGPIEGLLPWLRRNLPKTRILYYFPPGSWRKSLRGTPLGPLTDAIATPFPWNAEELTRLGVGGVEFVGHPLLDLVKPEKPVAEFAEQFGIDTERPVVGLLPGSRKQEIAEILPVQLEAAAIIQRRVPGVQFLLGLAPTVDRADVIRAVEALRKKNAHLRDALHRFEEMLRDEIAGRRVSPPLITSEGTLVSQRMLDGRRDSPTMREVMEEADAAARSSHLHLAIVENATYNVMTASDVLMVTSGTATLEAAILSRPMVIMYRLSRTNFLEYLIVKNKLPKHIGMPNIIAEERIVPELVQDDATPAAISSEVIALLLEPERILKMRESLRKAVAQLGESGGAGRAAKMAVALASDKS